MYSQTTKYLIPLLNALLNGKINSFEINHLVRIAHSFASVRLTQLIRSHKIHFEIYPFTISSLALDCIAELFQRDEDGNYYELIAYFSLYEGSITFTDEEIVQRFQALVFSKLNDGIIRLYHEHDPILSKILRNLKSAIKKDNTLIMFDRFGELFFSPSTLEERNDHLVEFPFDEMEAALANLVHEKGNIKRYLNSLSDLLQNSNCYRRFVKVIDLAVIIKSLSIKYDFTIISSSNIENDMLQNDIVKIVETSLLDLRKSFDEMYLRSNKMKSEDLNKYMNAVGELLKDTFVLNNGNNLSHYDYLQKSIPGINYDEYHNQHRIRFEYMVKLAKKHTIEKIKQIIE